MEKEIIFVAGGSRGIGEAIVRRSAGENRIVVFTYHQSEAKALALSRELSDQGFENYPYSLDVAMPEAVTELVETLGNRFHRIDAVVTSAGMTRDNLLAMTDDEDWQTVIQTNLSGVFHVCRAVSKIMIRRRKGNIITLSSIAAAIGGRGQGNYCASKGGVEAFTRSMAVELAPKNIRANCVAPGVIRTDMSRRIIEKYEDIITPRILLDRIGRPEDVAGVVHFLLSNDAAYITGQVIRVDGGMLSI